MGRRVRRRCLAVVGALFLVALIIVVLYGASDAAGLRDVLDRLASGDGGEFDLQGTATIVFQSNLGPGDWEIWLITYDRGNNSVLDLSQVTDHGYRRSLGHQPGRNRYDSEKYRRGGSGLRACLEAGWV